MINLTANSPVFYLKVLLGQVVVPWLQMVPAYNTKHVEVGKQSCDQHYTLFTPKIVPHKQLLWQSSILYPVTPVTQLHHGVGWSSSLPVSSSHRHKPTTITHIFPRSRAARCFFGYHPGIPPEPMITISWKDRKGGT